MSEPSVLIPAEAVNARVRELGAAIERDYQGKELTVVVVLAGSFIFAADLVRATGLALTIDFFGVRSYGDTQSSSGVVQITHDLARSVEGKHVLLVEDIVDTGLTVKFLIDTLRTRAPASLKLVSLLHKPARTTLPVPIDYLGFTIDDVFVVGYGLDYGQRYRNLPYLGVLSASDETSDLP